MNELFVRLLPYNINKYDLEWFVRSANMVGLYTGGGGGLIFRRANMVDLCAGGLYLGGGGGL